MNQTTTATMTTRTMTAAMIFRGVMAVEIRGIKRLAAAVISMVAVYRAV